MWNYYFPLYSALIIPKNWNTVPSFELSTERKTWESSGGTIQGRSTYKKIQAPARQECWICSVQGKKNKGRASRHFLSYFMCTGQCRAKLFFVVNSARDERQVSQIAGKKIRQLKKKTNLVVKRSVFCLLTRMEILHLTRQGSPRPDLILKVSLLWAQIGLETSQVSF